MSAFLTYIDRWFYIRRHLSIPHHTFIGQQQLRHGTPTPSYFTVLHVVLTLVDTTCVKFDPNILLAADWLWKTISLSMWYTKGSYIYTDLVDTSEFGLGNIPWLFLVPNPTKTLLSGSNFGVNPAKTILSEGSSLLPLDSGNLIDGAFSVEGFKANPVIDEDSTLDCTTSSKGTKENTVMF